MLTSSKTKTKTKEWSELIIIFWNFIEIFLGNTRKITLLIHMLLNNYILFRNFFFFFTKNIQIISNNYYKWIIWNRYKVRI